MNRNTYPRIHRGGLRARLLRLEPLEPRQVLSAPTVLGVIAGSSQWSASFVEALQAAGLGEGGYAIPSGSSRQLDRLPWKAVDQIRITFDQDVRVEQSDLSISGVNRTAYGFDNFTYDPASHTATWTLAEPVYNDKLLLDLDGNGLDPVANLANEVLDGNWTNAESSYPSGDATAGGDFEFLLNVLTGDADGNGTVNAADTALVSGAEGKAAGQPGYSALFDIDGDAGIDAADTAEVSAALGSSSPTGDPAGTSNDAPTTSGLPDYNALEDDLPFSIALDSGFADDNPYSSHGLVYTIVGNTNPDLFDSISVDGFDVDVLLSQHAYGDAVLTIRATDPEGLVVETPLTIHVAPVNDPPSIVACLCREITPGTYEISGSVMDIDDAVAGMIVEFAGDLAGLGLTATVQANGTFSGTWTFSEVISGWGIATTRDPHDLRSEEYAFEVVISPPIIYG